MFGSKLSDFWHAPWADRLFAVGLVGLVLGVFVLGAWGWQSVTGSDGTSAQSTTSPVSPTDSYAASTADEVAVEEAVSAQLRVNSARATCERRNRQQTFYVCSVLKGEKNIATGLILRCAPPVRGSSPVSCTSTRMTPRQRCVYGVRSGHPVSSSRGIFLKEAVVCRNLGVPID